MKSLLTVLEEAQRIASDSNWCSLLGPGTCLDSPIVPKRMAYHDEGKAATDKPKNWKKPKDMPRRPLSAYNLFFKTERLRIVASISEGPNRRLGRNGKTVGVGFAGLARDIASKWKALSGAEKMVFEEQAKIEKVRYRKEMSVWRSIQAPKQKLKKQAADASLLPVTSTSAAMEDLDHSAFDASDDTSQSLHQIMQDAIRLASQCGKRSQLPQWGQSPTTVFSAPDPAMSMSFPASDVGNGFPPSSGPAVIKSLSYKSFFASNEENAGLRGFATNIYYGDVHELEPVNDSVNEENSCWREVATNINCGDFHELEPVDDSVDDLSDFMETMERGDY